LHAFTICNEPTNLLHKFEKENTTPPKSSIPLHWWNYLCFKWFLSMLWIVHLIKKQRVHHTVACLPFTLESILIQKKNYENSNISPCKNIIFKKKSSKRNQDPSRYHNSTTNLKCQPKPKISSFKNPRIKIDLLPKGQSPLLLSYILIMNLNTISLPTKARPIKLDLFNNENLHTFSHKWLMSYGSCG